MKKILVLLLAVGLLASCNGSKEPEAQGLKLSVWVGRLDDADAAIRLDALSVLKEMGKPAATAEDKVRTLARNDQYPDVKMKAIEALQAMGKNVDEFKAFIAYYTAPFDDTPTEDGGMSNDEFDNEGGGSSDDGGGSMRKTRGSSGNDLDILREMIEDSLKLQTKDSSGNASKIPQTQQDLVQLGAKRRSESMQNLMDQIGNPSVLADLLSNGDMQEKVYALSKLSLSSGENERVVSALDLAKLDPDSNIRRLAKEAGKHWTLP